MHPAFLGQPLLNPTPTASDCVILISWTEPRHSSMQHTGRSTVSGFETCGCGALPTRTETRVSPFRSALIGSFVTSVDHGPAFPYHAAVTWGADKAIRDSGGRATGGGKAVGQRRMRSCRAGRWSASQRNHLLFLSLPTAKPTLGSTARGLQDREYISTALLPLCDTSGASAALARRSGLRDRF
jgi:hypothetical protein